MWLCRLPNGSLSGGVCGVNRGPLREIAVTRGRTDRIRQKVRWMVGNVRFLNVLRAPVPMRQHQGLALLTSSSASEYDLR